MGIGGCGLLACALALAAPRPAAGSRSLGAFRNVPSGDLPSIEIALAPVVGGSAGAAGPRECLVLYAGDPASGPRTTASLRSVDLLGPSVRAIWPARTDAPRFRALLDSTLSVSAAAGSAAPPNPALTLLLVRAAADSTVAFRTDLDLGASRLLFSKMRAAAASDRGASRELARLACEWGLVPLTSAVDVTSLVSVESSVLRREKSGLVDVKVRLINTSDEFVAPPITLVLGEAVSGLVVDPDGFTCTARPAGRAYVMLSPRGGLGPANSLGGVVRLKNPPPGEPNLQARVFSGSATP
jgi:hypothetical protein